MSFLNKLFHRAPKENTVAFRREMAKRLDGKHLRYVTERTQLDDGRIDDVVIGREGALIVKENTLLVYASADVLMRLEIDEMTPAELLSGDGVILSGCDIEHGGAYRTVVAYYTYYL
jgi:hypothetical protein